jgi:outer membrane protein
VFKLRYVLLMISVMVIQGNLWAQELKIGVVNSELVIQSYPRFKQAEEQLAREMQGMEAERKSWMADMERLKASIGEKETSLRAGQNVMSEKRKQVLQTEIDSLSMDYSIRYNEQMQSEQTKFNTRRAELLSEVFEEVNGVIEEIGEESDFQLIIDASNGSIVYAKDPEDLNDQLIKRLQDK